MPHTIAIDVYDKTVPEGNHRNIPVIDQPNPVIGFDGDAKQVRALIQLPTLYVYESGTNNIINGSNYFDYFPEENPWGGGGGGGGGDVSRYTVEKFTNSSTGEVTYKLMQSLNQGSYVAVGEVVGMRGNQMLVTYGNQLSILDTVLYGIKEKIDATYNFTTFNELNITTSGKTMKEITDELYAKGLPTNTIVTGQLYSSALPFSGNGEAEVMINGPAFWWKCTSLNVAPYSWNAICGGGSWSGVIMDWTPTYQTEEPMVFKGSATLTADSTDTTKCTVTVSTPSTASRIKRGYMYKVTSIAVSPIYTGTIKVGDTLIADKDAPVIGPTWTVDTDWTVVPSGDEEGKIYYAAAGGGLQLSGADNNEFGHSNAAITPQTELGVYKVKHDALGHVVESEPIVPGTAVTGLVTAAAGGVTPPNAITYTTYTNERLSFKQIGANTDNRFVTTAPLPFATREVNFQTKASSIVDGVIANVTTYTKMGRCNVADDGTILAWYGDSNYTEDGSNGQVMVYVPKFYYKTTPITLDGVKIRKARWSVSDIQIDNTWKLHPAFIGRSGNEIDYFLYSAFQGVGEDANGNYSASYNTTSYKLASVGGNTTKPIDYVTRATVRTMAANRGTGWYSVGIKQIMAVLMLFAVEYGVNGKAVVGKGTTDNGSNIHNTGVTVGNTTVGDKTRQDRPMAYRGIEDLWGNHTVFIDGVTNDTTAVYVCPNYNFVENTEAMQTYTTVTGFEMSFFGSWYYIGAFGYDSTFDWLFLQAETVASVSNSAIGDFTNVGAGTRTCALNGTGIDGAGPFAFYFVEQPGNTNRYVGGRLMYVPA